MNRLDGQETDRDKAGRFAPGNPGGPGRPRRDTERAYLATIADACPPATWREIVAKAVEDAKDGDAGARTWLASYLVGRPASSGATLHAIAVSEVSGTDPVETDADWEVMRNALNSVL